VGLYRAIAVMDQLEAAQAELERHLVTGLDGDAGRAETSNRAASAGGWKRYSPCITNCPGGGPE
jgi:hypothetical protein